MTLSDDARNIFERLPANCERVGGITLQRELDIGKLAYQSARDELKTAGLVKVGGGRGGSLARIEDAELPEEEKPTSQAERLEFAREAKKAKSREQREWDEIKDIARRWCRENLNYEIRQPHEIHWSYGKILVAVWREGEPVADMIQIPQLEIDKMKAHYVR